MASALHHLLSPVEEPLPAPPPLPPLNKRARGKPRKNENNLLDAKTSSLQQLNGDVPKIAVNSGYNDGSSSNLPSSSFVQGSPGTNNAQESVPSCSMQAQKSKVDFLLSTPTPTVKSRGRGRPRKNFTHRTPSQMPLQDGSLEERETPQPQSVGGQPIKQGRGRPRKIRLDHPHAAQAPQAAKVVQSTKPPVHKKSRASARIMLRAQEGRGRGARERRAADHYSPNNLESKKRRRRQQRQSEPKTLGNPHVTRIVNRLSNMRVQLAFLDAYELEGWRNGAVDKLKPTAELLKVRNQLAHGKRMILRDLKDFDTVFANDKPLPKDVSELDDDEIVCSKCGSTTTTDTNDIVLCDCGPCHRAYHQDCLEPILAELPHEDEEWYCPRCDGVFKCLVMINSTFDEKWETMDEIFPDVDANTVDEEEQDSASEKGDEDDDEGDDEDPAEDEEESEEDVASLIIHGKRRRAVVDYRKLHGEMFPAGHDDDDDNEYEPAAATKAASASDESDGDANHEDEDD
ncbi:hypothetical protein Ae201684P_013043 [Aphanomyces euteiches]|nr:hypothetical protein Ae201684P_013043 [Aphanomyces euteiches]KAH9157521.1 hypothetical protein AeRB84_000623 [Aphanomyces euteiches]